MMLERQGVVFVEVAFFFRLLVLKLLVTCFLNCQVGLAKITFAKCGFSILTPVANHKSIWTSISGASKHGYIFLKHQKRGMIPSILAVPLANFQGLGVVSPTYNGSSIKPLQGGKPTSYKWGYVTLANHLDHLVSAIYCGKITPLITGSAKGPTTILERLSFPKKHLSERVKVMKISCGWVPFLLTFILEDVMKISWKCGTQTSSVSRSLLRSINSWLV